MTERGRPRGFDRKIALRKAMLTFWRKGFDHTSMIDLTDAMGIGSPSLYAAFGSKEALFCEAVELYQNTIGPRIWGPLERDDTIEEAIAGFLMRTADAFCSPEFPCGCLIILGSQYAQDTGGAVGDELRSRRSDNITRLKQRFDRAVLSGELSSNFDSGAAARFYAALQAGMAILAHDGATSASLRAVARSGFQALAEMKRETQP